MNHGRDRGVIEQGEQRQREALSIGRDAQPTKAVSVSRTRAKHEVGARRTLIEREPTLFGGRNRPQGQLPPKP